MTWRHKEPGHQQQWHWPHCPASQCSSRYDTDLIYMLHWTLLPHGKVNSLIPGGCDQKFEYLIWNISVIFSLDECHRTSLRRSQHYFRWWFGAIRQQPIIWTYRDCKCERPFRTASEIGRWPHLVAVTWKYKKPCYFTIWWRLLCVYVTDRLYFIVV